MTVSGSQVQQAPAAWHNPPESQQSGEGGSATVRIELYGVLAELAGASALEMAPPAEEATVGAVLERLRRDHPALAEQLDASAVAIGDRLVSADTPVAADSRLALLPPVSGG
ncbi:MoaD/ThiS family protein [Halorhodospira neutriphila]|uniref:MoaD/ThiS family protein n=1 Tax=Halorhodospira neutriphila TaxID=168379 RepID=UPI001A92C43F